MELVEWGNRNIHPEAIRNHQSANQAGNTNRQPTFAES
jgi:hypothetical protein